MPALRPQDVAKILESHGYELDRIKGSHHIYRHPQTGQRVVVPFHKRDLPRGTQRAILRQAGINLDELND